jgi:hypothetical protein
MITAITTYNLPTPMTREEAQSAFLTLLRSIGA